MTQIEFDLCRGFEKGGGYLRYGLLVRGCKNIGSCDKNCLFLTVSFIRFELRLKRGACLNQRSSLLHSLDQLLLKLKYSRRPRYFGLKVGIYVYIFRDENGNKFKLIL